MIKTNNVWNYDDVETEYEDNYVLCRSNYFGDVKLVVDDGIVHKLTNGYIIGFNNFLAVESIFVIFLITAFVIWSLKADYNLSP